MGTVRSCVGNRPRGAEDKDNAEHDYSTSLVNFPTELLVKILSYLPTRDRFMMRNVSQRFRDVSETPLLWKECIWNYEPRHVSSIRKVLIENGEHVRRIFFPAHLTVKLVRKLASHCTQVTHLSLPRDTQVTLDDLEKLVRTMIHLHQLDVFAEGKFIQKDEVVSITGYRSWHEHIKGLLKVTATSVKELNLRVIKLSWAVRESIMELASQSHTLPIINIFGNGSVFNYNLSSLWVELHSKYESSSFEISLYDYRQIPMNLYPLIPLRKFKFGPSVTSPFIQLSSYGIVGIQKDTFCLSEYNCYGKVRYILTPMHKLYNDQNIPFGYSQIDSVSYVDFSNLNIDSNHLEQLAVVCPNLQRLNLQGNVNCLKHLQGLRAIVNMCQNLEGINLTKISVSRVESHVLLWELFSSLKKLTHLAIDLCLMKASNANKQKCIDMFKTCQCLKALEITRDYINGCRECTDVTDFYFSYFPSLTYCRMYCFRYSALTYAITNCHKLKYLYEKDARKESLLPLSNNCNLEQLCIYSLSLNLTDELVQVLSANGQLERVVLYVKSITVNGLTTLINNSQKLILLHISMIEPLFNDIDVYARLARPPEIDQQHTDRVKAMFSHRESFTVGNFSVHVIAGTIIRGKLDIDLVDTDLNSLWPSLEPDGF